MIERCKLCGDTHDVGDGPLKINDILVKECPSASLGKLTFLHPKQWICTGDTFHLITEWVTKPSNDLLD